MGSSRLIFGTKLLWQDISRTYVDRIIILYGLIGLGLISSKNTFWKIPIPHNCSWIWRKILQLRVEVRPLIRYVVRDGTDTSLWFDSWLPLGSIFCCFGERIIYDSGLPRHARVASIIQDGRWHWPVANSPNLLVLKQSILASLVPQPLCKD